MQIAGIPCAEPGVSVICSRSPQLTVPGSEVMCGRIVLAAAQRSVRAESYSTWTGVSPQRQESVRGGRPCDLQNGPERWELLR